jgi:hypothetical protein
MSQKEDCREWYLIAYDSACHTFPSLADEKLTALSSSTFISGLWGELSTLDVLTGSQH